MCFLCGGKTCAHGFVRPASLMCNLIPHTHLPKRVLNNVVALDEAFMNTVCPLHQTAENVSFASGSVAWTELRAAQK